MKPNEFFDPFCALPGPAVVPDVLLLPLAPPDLDRYDALLAVAR